MEEANPLLPVVRRADDCVDKDSGSIAEIEELPEDFRKFLHTELNWSRSEAGGGESGSTGWVFWDRQDDRPNTLPVSDFESVNVIPNFSPKVTKVKDKIRLALERIPLHLQYGPSLVQFWAATKIEERTLLTTRNQPFALGKMGSSTWELCEYRMKSMGHKFYGDIGESGEEELGVPGRVFLHQLPESTPDVLYYSLKEYPQHADASCCQVRASWALPVFDFSNPVPVGVLELVSTVNTITDWQDKSFLDNLYGVLQDQGLQSLNVYSHCVKKDEDKALTTAFHELSLVLESVCKSHKLPLALTWVPCNDCNGLLLGERLYEDGEYLGAFKANDDDLVNFLITSTGHHLWNGHVAAKVIGTTSMLYCSDVTQFSIAEHPLAPFARQCKLSGWFTICLTSSWTGDYIYVLEFFLPTSSKDNEDTTTISTILGTMKANSETFKLTSGKELGEELSVSVLGFQNGQRQDYVQTIQASLELLKNGGQTLSVIGVDDGMDVINAEQNDKVITISEGDTTKTQERKRKRTGVSAPQPSPDVPLPDIDKVGVPQPLCDVPPCDIYKVGTPQPSCAVLQEVISHLTSDIPSNQASDSRDCRIHLGPPQNINEVGAQQPLHVEHEEGSSELTVDKVGAPQSSSRDVPLHNVNKVGSSRPSRDVPPPNVNKVGSSWPLSVEQKEGTSELSQLTWDMSSNQALASEAHIEPHDAASKEKDKETETVMIKAKCPKYTRMFYLPLSSGVKELKEQVFKRLNPEDGNYDLYYKDDDGDLIIIVCDDDVRNCINFFRSQGIKTVPIVILPCPK